MKSVEFLVLGGGPAGLGAACLLQEKVQHAAGRGESPARAGGA